MIKVSKTTFDEEQKAKDEAFLKLTPLQRWEQALRLRELMRKPNLNYSYEGLKVTLTKIDS